MDGQFERISALWMEWSVRKFVLANAASSLTKAKGEIKELLFCLSFGTEKETLFEYVDVIMCVLHSAKKAGFTIEQITAAFKEKSEINFNREWVLDKRGNTYSHKK
ncbi:MAG: dATP/dGTP pyrophosphohydrolase domain-containing protein [Flavisolibacter sp.]|jgi:hypothetical protein